MQNLVPDGRQGVERLAPVDGCPYLVALELEDLAQRLARLHLVLDDENRGSLVGGLGVRHVRKGYQVSLRHGHFLRVDGAA